MVVAGLDRKDDASVTFWQAALNLPPMKIGAGYRPYFHGIVVRARRACWLSPP
jgi:hypothetical protein